MLRALLGAVIVWGLALGRLSPVLALTAAAVAAGLLWLPLRHGHSHDDWTAIDYYALQSRLHSVPAGLKALTALALIVLTLAARSPLVSLLVWVLTAAVTVLAGRTPARTWARLFLTPLTFVLLSGLALLFDFDAVPGGVVSLPCFGVYLTIPAQAQTSTLVILTGAAASVSCLYALCLSTPMPQLIAALGRVHVPELLIELMYLIYRYIFVLSGTLSQMKIAAAARLGYGTFRRSFTTTASIMTSLLVSSFQRASASFDAMQSRCYEGKLRFLEQKSPLRAGHLGSAAVLVALPLAAALLERLGRG